jgi:hypothetical protein
MNHLLGILLNPRQEWATIRADNSTVKGHFGRYLLWVALLAPVAWYVGSTQVGWQLGDRTIRLTEVSAAQIMALFYLAILIAATFLGYMIHWMSETYEATGSTIGKGVSIAGYTLTPLFVCGLSGFYPVLWLDMLLGCVAAAYTVYLLYVGVPIVMQIPSERGFLFASAMVGVGLIMCAALLGATVILWEMGAMPVFTE